jgi:hypothetical protein
MASSVLCKMLFWVVNLWLTILIWFKSFLGNMEEEGPLLGALLKLILGRPLTQFSGLS